MHGTPAIDFTSMLYEIVSKDAREIHRDKLIEHYFDTFSSTLKQLEFNGKIPELTDFQQEIVRCGILEFGLLVCYGAFHYIDWTGMDFMESLTESKDFFDPVIPIWRTNKDWQRYFIRTVNEMINKGILD